jgi:predicted flap endonuclease-1-like 5' DNA nuclease
MAAPVSVAAVAASTVDADANVAIEDHSTSVEFDVETSSDLPVSDATPEALSTIIENDVDDIPPPITLDDLEVTNSLPLLSRSRALASLSAETMEEPPIEVPMLAAQPDNLKIVEGIGPKIEELCNGIDVWTWKQLSETSVERLQEMLDAAGKRYQIHNPSTWPAQALMAHDGKWDELKVYQDHLKGGKEPEK